MRVIGLDVCKNAVVACTLLARPSEPRQLYHDLDFPKFYANAEGIRQILDIGADVAVMEPTGVNYSKIWATKLAEAGVKVVLVGHKELRRYRENLDLPDKDDPADALALACYYWEHHQSDRRFVRSRDPVIARMREIVLRLHHFSRVQSPIVNRIRQDLAWQLPETAQISLKGRLFWGWLAGKSRSLKYDNLLQNTVGLGLKEETRLSALALWELHMREASLEREMRSLLYDPKFASYRQVFAQFGFGERIEALILSQIYPLENYLVEGKPEVKIRKGKLSGKPTKRHLSRRRFQKALGVAPVREESGDKRSSKKGGSSLCRKALWQWIFTRIETSIMTCKGLYGNKLADSLKMEKERVPVKLARSRVAARAVSMLFYALVEELGG